MFSRLLVRAAVLLVFGLLTTWAVAWTCAWFVPLQGARLSREYVSVQEPRWAMQTIESLGVMQVKLWPSASAPPRESDLHLSWGRAASLPKTQPNPDVCLIDVAAGWPTLALMYECDLRQTSRMPFPSSTRPAAAAFANQPVVRWGFDPRRLINPHAIPSVTPRLNDQLPVTGYLPIRPIWRGLLFNTALFAGMWWLLSTLLASRVHLRRRRRGRCPSCRYPLKGLSEDRCPECGTRTDQLGMRRDRIVGRAAMILFFVALGAATTIAVVCWCALKVDYQRARVSEAWLTQLPSDWLVRQYDAFGSTRVAWLYDQKAATVRINQQRRQEMLARMIAEGQVADDAPLAKQLAEDWERRRQQVVDWQRFMRYGVDEQIAPRLLPRGDADESGPQFGSQVIDARGWPMRAMWSVFRTTSHPGYSAAAPDQTCAGVLGGIPIDAARRRGMHFASALPLGFVWIGFAVDTALFAIAWLAVMAGTSWVLVQTRNGLRRMVYRHNPSNSGVER